MSRLTSLALSTLMLAAMFAATPVTASLTGAAAAASSPDLPPEDIQELIFDPIRCPATAGLPPPVGEVAYGTCLAARQTAWEATFIILHYPPGVYQAVCMVLHYCPECPPNCEPEAQSAGEENGPPPCCIPCCEVNVGGEHCASPAGNVVVQVSTIDNSWGCDRCTGNIIVQVGPANSVDCSPCVGNIIVQVGLEGDSLACYLGDAAAVVALIMPGAYMTEEAAMWPLGCQPPDPTCTGPCYHDDPTCYVLCGPEWRPCSEHIPCPDLIEDTYYCLFVTQYVGSHTDPIVHKLPWRGDSDSASIDAQPIQVDMATPAAVKSPDLAPEDIQELIFNEVECPFAGTTLPPPVGEVALLAYGVCLAARQVAWEATFILLHYPPGVYQAVCLVLQYCPECPPNCEPETQSGGDDNGTQPCCIPPEVNVGGEHCASPAGNIVVQVSTIDNSWSCDRCTGNIIVQVGPSSSVNCSPCVGNIIVQVSLESDSLACYLEDVAAVLALVQPGRASMAEEPAMWPLGCQPPDPTCTGPCYHDDPTCYVLCGPEWRPCSDHIPCPDLIEDTYYCLFVTQYVGSYTDPIVHKLPWRGDSDSTIIPAVPVMASPADNLVANPALATSDTTEDEDIQALIFDRIFCPVVSMPYPAAHLLYGTCMITRQLAWEATFIILHYPPGVYQAVCLALQYCPECPPNCEPEAATANDEPLPLPSQAAACLAFCASIEAQGNDVEMQLSYCWSAPTAAQVSLIGGVCQGGSQMIYESTLYVPMVSVGR